MECDSSVIGGPNAVNGLAPVELNKHMVCVGESVQVLAGVLTLAVVVQGVAVSISWDARADLSYDAKVKQAQLIAQQVSLFVRPLFVLRGVS